MNPNTPPSPALTKVEFLPAGFHELLQHNASANFPRELEPNRAHSQPVSRYGTPGPTQPSPKFDASMAYQQRGGSGELVGKQQISGAPRRLTDLQDVYHQQAMYSHDASAYGPIPQPSQPYGTPATSPPTPRASDLVGTRSGNPAHGNFKVLGPKAARIEKATSSKKKTGRIDRPDKSKGVKNMPHLDKPLSELTKDFETPIFDIEAFVHRPIEVRQQEVDSGKNPGKVKRPMNAFMLYRKAMQARAKEWAAQYNHQVISRIAGQSWPMEPEHIREQFKRWAEIERDNHQKAFPNYKFTPSKPQKPAKNEGRYDDSEGSDLDEYDWTGRSASRVRTVTNTPHDEADYLHDQPMYPATHPHPYQLEGLHGLSMMHQNKTGLSFGSPTKSIGASCEHRDLHSGQYYDTHIRTPRRHLPHGLIDEALMRKTPSPSLAFTPNNAGLHQQFDFNQYQTKIEHAAQSQMQRQQTHTQPQHHGAQFETRIDPSLIPGEEGLFETGNFNVANMYDCGLGETAHQAWHNAQLTSGNESDSQFSHAIMGLEETLSLEQHTQFLRGADDWQTEPLPEAAEFDMSWVEPKSEAP